MAPEFTGARGEAQADDERAVALRITRAGDEHERDRDRSRPASRPRSAWLRRRYAAASGPTIANESGTPPIEIIQSRLDTRPSSPAATSRCSNVTHTTTRTVIEPSATNATIMRLPDRVDHAEPGRHQHPQRPDEVEDGERLAGQPATLPDDHRGEHRPDAAGAEHQAQVDRRSVQRRSSRCTEPASPTAPTCRAG